jgi:hypothetical protein
LGQLMTLVTLSIGETGAENGARKR